MQDPTNDESRRSWTLHAMPEWLIEAIGEAARAERRSPSRQVEIVLEGWLRGQGGPEVRLTADRPVTGL